MVVAEEEYTCVDVTSDDSTVEPPAVESVVIRADGDIVKPFLDEVDTFAEYKGGRVDTAVGGTVTGVTSALSLVDTGTTMEELTSAMGTVVGENTPK